MWQDLVDQKDKWIGGTLKDYCSPSDRRIVKTELIGAETTITDFVLTDQYFTVVGDDFDCGGGREFLSIVGEGDFPAKKGALVFLGYDNHEFHIMPK